MVSTYPIISELKKQGRAVLTEIESKQLLEKAGISTVKTRLASTENEAVAIAGEIGFPVVLKISSPDITHKSDAGGVKVGINNAEEVQQNYREIIEAAGERYPEAVIQGVAVQTMAVKGTEVIIGTFKDPQFGPVVMFGLGGVFVEVLKDVSFRLVPLTRQDASEMIREIRGYSLLEGYRGQEPAGISYLEELLLEVSAIAENNPDIKEMDFNPVFAYKDGAVVVDARIIIED
jgi:acyl-CoA synthetase (NDP forming)